MENQKLQISPPAARWGARHQQAVVMALCSFGIYAHRISLSVAIVPMTGMGMETETVVPGSNDTAPTAHPVYDWDERTQGLVLSSFFWGYMVMQIPAGILTQRLGAHRFLTGAMFTTSLTCALLPPCAFFGGWVWVCISRMLQGLAQGFVYPSIFTMMGLWLPVEERGRMAGFILGAQAMGPIIATPVAGWLSAYCGWPSIFYSFGAMGFVIFAIVFKFGASSTATHRTISAEERAYIEASLNSSEKKFPIPWRRILLSGPAWATIMTMALQGGVFLAFLTKIPTYLSSVLKFDIKDNGVLTALPYLATWILSFVFSWTCDWIVERNYLNLTQARKLYNSISHVGSGILMILLGYCTSPTLSVLLLIATIGVMSASYIGAQANFVDLTPNFSGTIFSISNFLSAVLGVAGPIVVSLIVTEQGSVIQWRMVYFLFATIVFVSNLHFVLCGSAKVQPWNFPSTVAESEKGEKETASPENG